MEAAAVGKTTACGELLNSRSAPSRVAKKGILDPDRITWRMTESVCSPNPAHPGEPSEIQIPIVVGENLPRKCLPANPMAAAYPQLEGGAIIDGGQTPTKTVIVATRNNEMNRNRM
jgi:hypothetical protein